MRNTCPSSPFPRFLSCTLIWWMNTATGTLGLVGRLLRCACCHLQSSMLRRCLRHATHLQLYGRRHSFFIGTSQSLLGLCADLPKSLLCDCFVLCL